MPSATAALIVDESFIDFADDGASESSSAT
jgi:histidinol-phosphate/aromatic aminotransferase/cobyric acid decarboxylase-like protein